jgi:hypothetical protein
LFLEKRRFCRKDHGDFGQPCGDIATFEEVRTPCGLKERAAA